MKNLIRKKDNPYSLKIADGLPVEYEDGWIREEIYNVRLRIGHHEERISLDIITIKYDILLGMDWL